MPKSDRKVKVLVGGCFDILHNGHITFLKKAKSMGNYLIVLLESDENIRKLKGYPRPIQTQQERSKILKSLKFIDKVIALKGVLRDIDYQNLIEKINPDIIALTRGDPKTTLKKNQAASINAKVAIINKVPGFSTSKLAKLLKID